MKSKVTTSSSLRPRGPYSLGIVSKGPFLFVSGMGPVDLETQQFVTDSFEQEAALTFEHLKTVVESAGATLGDTVKVTVYLRDMQDFETMNRVYQLYFPQPYPARTTVQSDLAGFSIEVDAIVTLAE